MGNHISKGHESPNKSKIKKHEAYSWLLFHNLYEGNEEKTVPKLRMKDDLFFTDM